MRISRVALLFAVVLAVPAAFAISDDLDCSTYASDVPMPGGYTTVPDLNSTLLLTYASDAFAENFNVTGDACDWDDYEITITDACSQVVAGTNYIIDFVVRLPSCDTTANAATKVYEPLPSENEVPSIEAFEIDFTELNF